MRFELTLKNGKTFVIRAGSQEAAMRVYKEFNPEAEIVKCHWLPAEKWEMSVSV